jgi:plasmid stabilization system protein ParE
MRIVWTEPALCDLHSLRGYVAQNKPFAADRQVGLILAAVAGMAEFPGSGQAGRGKWARELVVGKTPNLIPYRLREDKIEVLRVLHGRQRWPETL